MGGNAEIIVDHDAFLTFPIVLTYFKLHLNIFKGYDCCSNNFISFHDIGKTEMLIMGLIVKRHEYLLKNGIVDSPLTFKSFYHQYLEMYLLESI